jgi:hypothetical protein
VSGEGALETIAFGRSPSSSSFTASAGQVQVSRKACALLFSHLEKQHLAISNQVVVDMARHVNSQSPLRAGER